MLWPKHLFLDFQRAPVEWFSTIIVALVYKKPTQIVEACGSIGMLWPKHLFSEFEPESIKPFSKVFIPSSEAEEVSEFLSYIACFFFNFI